MLIFQKIRMLFLQNTCVVLDFFTYRYNVVY